MRSVRRLFSMASVVLVLGAWIPLTAVADMEGRMPFTHVHYDASGIDNSGAITVDAFQDGQGVSDLRVEAFGSTHAIAKSGLGAINGYKFNSVGVSYSRGYPGVGGRTVYVLLYQVFSTGPQAVAMVVVREHMAPKVVIIKPQPGMK